VTGRPEEVARHIYEGVSRVRLDRRRTGDAYYFNWRLMVDPLFQQPFLVSHEAMSSLDLSGELQDHMLAANLRRAFSGIVTGNVKDEGVRAVESYGPYEIHGDTVIMEELDRLLRAFVSQGRMRLPGATYTPCFRVVP
jgi:hypothetical protein